METTKLSHWLGPKRFGRLVAWLQLSACLMAGTAFAYLTDILLHLPLPIGTATYNTFTPNLPGFPAVGGTFTDPVFGSVIRRLTNNMGNTNQDDNYAHHWVNANGTLAFARCPGLTDTCIVQVATGAVLHTQQPDGSSRVDIAWDANDPDKYYFYNGSSLMRRSLTAQTSTAIKSFGSTLQANGGSVNTQSADGRYFLVRYGGAGHIWDSQDDVVYAGNIPLPGSAGYVGITPDGALAYSGGNSGSSTGDVFLSFAIDHNANTVQTTGTNFWSLCGDHGVAASATDGKNYLVTFNCNDATQVYAVEMHVNRSGMSAAQQKSDNGVRLLINMNPAFEDGGHFTAVSRGSNRNWVFISTESAGGDAFNSTPTAGNWKPFKQEIIAANVLTGEIRRLAHHRSRGNLPSNYQTQPRVTSSWDGSVVMWASNFNISSPSGYADLYVIQSPLGPGSSQIPTPQNLRFK